MINEWDSTDSGVDYGLPDYSDGAAGGNSFNINIPSGVNINTGAGPQVVSGGVPQYPATAPAIYARGGQAMVQTYPNSAAFGGNMLLLVLVVGIVVYVVMK